MRDGANYDIVQRMNGTALEIKPLTEEQNAPDMIELTSQDQLWLSSFGVDPEWENDEALKLALNETIATGSLRLNRPLNQDEWESIASARWSFFNFLGLPAELVDFYQSEKPSLTPLDIFIRNQRVMQSLGLNVTKVINAQPLAIGYAPESVRDKMANLTALDLNAPKVVNAHPAAISYAPESVRDKMANLTALGLNAAKVVNAHPSALGYAPELVREKIRFLQRSAKLLKWQYSAEDLVSARPVLLGYSTKKLAIFRRLAAYHLDPSERTIEPNKFSNALILPLEQYIIALNRIDDDQTLSVTELAKMARQIKLSSSERKQMLDEISPSLGRIGIMYSAYRDK